MKHFRFYILSFMVAFFALSCKKDNGGIDPNTIPFEELSKEQQYEKLSTYLQKFAGKKYRLLHRITFDDDETGNSVISNDEPNECESEIYIEMPEKLNAGLFMSQIPNDPSCGLLSEGSVPFSVFESPFTNYRWEINMFNIINDGESTIMFRGYVFIPPGIDMDADDISDYLVVIEPFVEDLQNADRNPGTIEARPYREYTFMRID